MEQPFSYTMKPRSGRVRAMVRFSSGKGRSMTSVLGTFDTASEARDAIEAHQKKYEESRK